MKKVLLAVIFSLLSWAGMVHFVSGQDDKDAIDRQTETIVEMQKLLRSNYQSLLIRMRLTAQSPDSRERERVEKAVELMDKLLISEEMLQLEKTIKDQRYSAAAEKAREVSEKLKRVLAVLDGVSDEWNPDNRIPTLVERLEQLKNLRGLQESLNDETNKLEDSALSDEDKLKLQELKQRQLDLRNQLDGMKDTLPEELKPLLDKASGHMENSQNQLHQESPDSAAMEQKKATDAIKDAEDKLENQLKKYRDKENDQLLIHVESELQKLRSGQIEVNQQTNEADLRRMEGQPMSRRDWSSIKNQQATLARTADSLAEKLQLGNVPIFGQILKGVGRDMDKVRDLLSDQDAGEYTQDLQNEIIIRLDDLIEALRNERKRRTNDGQDPPQQTDPDGKQPEPRLVPIPAELKMLLKRQEYLRSKHQRFMDRFPEVKDRSQMSDTQRRIYERLSQEQGENAGYLDSLLDTLFKKK